MKKIIINSQKIKALKKYPWQRGDRVVLNFSEPAARFFDRREKILAAADDLINQGINWHFLNLPLCLVLGYKRYCRFDKKNSASRIARCKDCAYKKECPGVNQEYVKKFGEQEILAVGAKHMITDLEKCLIKILRTENNISSQRVLQLAKRFKICSSCDDGNVILVTGQKLMNRGRVKRRIKKGNYYWSLIR